MPQMTSSGFSPIEPIIKHFPAHHWLHILARHEGKEGCHIPSTCVLSCIIKRAKGTPIFYLNIVSILPSSAFWLLSSFYVIIIQPLSLNFIFSVSRVMHLLTLNIHHLERMEK